MVILPDEDMIKISTNVQSLPYITFDEFVILSRGGSIKHKLTGDPKKEFKKFASNCKDLWNLPKYDSINILCNEVFQEIKFYTEQTQDPMFVLTEEMKEEKVRIVRTKFLKYMGTVFGEYESCIDNSTARDKLYEGFDSKLFFKKSKID